MEDAFQRPPLNDADSPEFRRLVATSKSLQADADKLSALQKHPDPEQKQYLQRLAANEFNPLAPAAASQLMNYPSEAMVKFLLDLIDKRNGPVRGAALASLTALDQSKGLQQARQLFDDPDVTVRIRAALAVGLAKDRQAVQPLTKVLPTAQPGVQVFLAWALMRCAQPGTAAKDQAIQRLKDIARSNSAGAAAQAVTILRGETDREIVGFLYESLYSRWDAVMFAAAESLNAIDRTYHDAALRGFSPERQAVLGQRLEALLYLLNKGPAPLSYGYLSSSPEVRDRQLVLECVARDLPVKWLPDLIAMVGDPERSVRERAVVLLLRAVEKYGMSAGPEKSVDATGWCHWWLRQYRVLAATEGRAMLRSPDGTVLQVAPGMRLEFRTEVVRIRPGTGAEGREGARVELTCDGSPLILEP